MLLLFSIFSLILLPKNRTLHFIGRKMVISKWWRSLIMLSNKIIHQQAFVCVVMFFFTLYAGMPSMLLWDCSKYPDCSPNDCAGQGTAALINWYLFDQHCVWSLCWSTQVPLIRYPRQPCYCQLRICPLLLIFGFAFSGGFLANRRTIS